MSFIERFVYNPAKSHDIVTSSPQGSEFGWVAIRSISKIIALGVSRSPPFKSSLISLVALQNLFAKSLPSQPHISLVDPLRYKSL